MTTENRTHLAQLIDDQHDEIMAEWREKIAPVVYARGLSAPQLTDELPEFLDQLAESIRTIDKPHSWTDDMNIEKELEQTAMSHGKQRFDIGFDIIEIVKEYGILREVVTDHAETAGLVIAGQGGHAFMFCFNKAVAAAVYAFQRTKEEEIRQRRKDYLAFVMHDIKTPLNAIMIAAHLIEEKADDPKLVSEMVQIVLRSGTQLDTLLQKTIAIQKTELTEEIDELIPRRFELWPLVQSVIDEFKAATGVSRVSIHNLVPSTFSIYADAIAMKSVISNLLSNAIKYTAGGKIVIGVTTGNDEHIEVWIRDSGSGMSEERLEHVFEKVEPDAAQKGSTGLGLFMVKKIIDAHSGHVSIESKKGEGTTVRISLPAGPQ